MRKPCKLSLIHAFPQDLRHHHTIEEDGYNRGRDALVEAAQIGGRWKIWKWKAKVKWENNLLTAGRRGINHDIAQDGRVAILNVYRVFGIGSLEIPYDPRYFALPDKLPNFLTLLQGSARQALHSALYTLGWHA